jgi:hypothetical protein
MIAYTRLRREAPERVERFRRELERYEKDRELAGPVLGRYPPGRVVRYAMREGGSLLLGAPLGLWGLAAHAVPYRLTGVVLRWRRPEADMVATETLATAALVYPLCWAVETWIVGWLAGTSACVVFLLALIPTGFFALTWQARLRRFRAHVRGFVGFLFHRDLHARLRARRHALRAELEALARLAEPATSVGEARS